MPPMFLFPGTAALMLAEHTFMSRVAIANSLRNYGRGGHSEGQPFWIKSVRPGNHHYRFAYVNGGWLVRATRLNTGLPA